MLELATVVTVIFILIVLSVPGYQQVRSHMDRINCSNNLHQLYQGASGYLMMYKHWPQVDPALFSAPNNAYSEAWIEAYLPFGVPRESWICPTIQRALGSPDFTQRANYRADYMAMPFDSKFLTPSKWPSAPWFAERANAHGTGNLVILANGSVTDLQSLRPVAAAALNGM